MKTVTSLRFKFKSFAFAVAGVAHGLRTQANLRVHVLATASVAAVGLWLGLPRSDWALVGLAIGFVWAAELMNTAVEAAVDLVTTDRHPLAKAAKDTAAGAVLVAAITSVAVGALVLGPPLVAAIRRFNAQ